MSAAQVHAPWVVIQPRPADLSTRHQTQRRCAPEGQTLTGLSGHATARLPTLQPHSPRAFRTCGPTVASFPAPPGTRSSPASHPCDMQHALAARNRVMSCQSAPHCAFGGPANLTVPALAHGSHAPDPPRPCSNDAFDAATGVDLTKRESIVNLSGSPPGLILLIANAFLLSGLGLFAHLLSGAAAQPVLCLLAVAIVCGYVYQGPPFRWVTTSRAWVTRLCCGGSVFVLKRLCCFATEV